MARPTKRSQDTARRIGVASASQIESWTSQDYGPATVVSEKRLDDHFRALAPLMGEGRDGDVAVLRMAGEHRLACARLREVLCRLIPKESATVAIDASGAESAFANSPSSWSDIHQVFPFLAKGADVAPVQPAYEILGTPPEEARADSLAVAELRIVQELAGEKTEDGDEADLAYLMSSAIESHFDMPVTGTSALAEVSSTLAFAASVARNARKWVETAPVEQLVSAVAATSNGFIPLCETFGICDFKAFGTEDHWRAVGKLAPAAAQVGAQMGAIAALQSAGLGAFDALALALGVEVSLLQALTLSPVSATAPPAP